MTNVKVVKKQAEAPRRPRAGWLGRDSLFWLVLVCVAFFLSELTPSLLRMPLGPDEIGYIAQLSALHSPVQLPPVHGQGAGLLAAPVTLLTTSLFAIRIWMALLSALGLFLGMLAWRGLRQAWVLALAALVLAILAVTQNSGVQIYPDYWGAIGVLALAGLFLHAVSGTMRNRVVLPLIGLATLLIVLMRPQNIAFILGPIIVATVVVPGWRKPKVWAALAIGIVLGVVQWLAESGFYGGLGSRLHLAAQEPPSFGLYFSMPYQVRTLSGPWYCPTLSSCPGVAAPPLIFWYIALGALAVIGLVVAWGRATKASSVLAAGIALWVVLLFSFLVPFAAPRYILPSLALGAILVADGIAWLVTESNKRALSAALVAAFLLIGVVTQRVVLYQQVAKQVQIRNFKSQAMQLKRFGIKPPCVVWTPYVGYYMGCNGPWTGQATSELLAHSFGGHVSWRRVHVPGLLPDEWVYVAK